jgi:hypothetical protein
MAPSVKERSQGTWTPQPHPAWVTKLNAIGTNGGSPATVVPLDEQSLLSAAIQATGLDDFGGDTWREGFRLLVEDLQTTAELTLVGRILVRAEIIRSLEARLRIAEAYKQHPEIADEKISQPVFITGMGRSGTSILHELFAEDDQFRVPLTWEWLYPAPPPVAATRASDPRIQQADIDHTFWFHITPEFQTMHDNRGDAPNECVLGTLHEFASQIWGAAHFVPNYDMWLALNDLGHVYRFHRHLLRLLQFRARGRWMLKGPSHMHSLPALFKEYPDARVIIIHRDPLKVLPSIASVFATLRWQRSDNVNYDAAVQMLAGAYPHALGAMMQQRAGGAIPPAQITDVHYLDLMKNPVETMTSLYEWLGVSLDDGGAQRIRDYLNARPKDRHGAHSYTFDSLVLDRAATREAYRAYQEHFGIANEV